jgi:predicted lysophospholipase L1 biosynthesis ABC-type transport system permease subunit
LGVHLSLGRDGDLRASLARSRAPRRRARAYAWILLGAVTGLVGAIAARTIVAGLRGQLLPAAPGVHVEKISTALAGPAPVSR